MKKVFLKSMLLLCALIVGSGDLWATEKSYTLSFKTTGSSSDSNTAWTTSSSLSNVLTSGSTYVSSISATSYVYSARDGRGAKFGSSSKAGTITFTLSDDGKVTAKRVVIKGGAYVSSSKAEASAVKVNNGTAVAFDQTVTSYTEEDITYNFSTPTDITSLSLTQNKASNGRFYVVSVTVYYDEDDSEGETATWTLDPTSATVMAGQSTSLQLTTNYDGALTFTSNNTSVATVSYNSLSKLITVTGVAMGSTTISATGAATATYKAINRNISVTVSHAVLESNVTDVMSGFGYSYFGLTPSGSNTYAQPEVSSTNKTDNYGITISFAKDNGGTYPRYDPDYVRFYNGNKLTITAPTGCKLRKIVFTEPASNKGWSGDMTASTGDYVNSEKTWYATTDDVASLVLTETTSTNRIGGMEVYLMVADKSITPSSETGKHYATFVAPYKVQLSAGVIAYIGTYNNSSSSLVLHNFEGAATGTVLPANTPVVLKATSSAAITAAVSTADANDVEDGETTNNLHGMYVATTAPANAYVLGYNSAASQETGFYQFSGTIPANRAYLIISGGAAQAAGIRIVESESQATNVEQIEASDKAVKFIENGRILILRDGNTYDALGRKIR